MYFENKHILSFLFRTQVVKYCAKVDQGIGELREPVI